MGTFWQDIKFGFRMLLQKPGFTVIALLTLALGIGATTAIFSIVYGTLLQPLPYPHSEQLVMVWSELKGDRNQVSAGDFVDWQNQSAQTFQTLSASTGTDYNIASEGASPEIVHALVMSPGWWTVCLAEPMLLGREFLPEEGHPGRDHVAVLTHKLWVRRFDSDSQILGKQIRLDGEPYTVVGVFPPGIEDRGNADIAVPLSLKPEDTQQHKNHYLFGFGRLRPGVSIHQAQAQMSVIQQRIAAAHPDDEKDRSISVEPLHDDWLPQSTRTELWLFLGAVGFVLLIACANVANLSLARASSREREIAVRAALGASPARILRQFLTESVLLALAGAAAGILVADAVLRGILSMIPVDTLPYEAEMSLNIPVLLFMLGISIFTGLLFGSAPAWQASRVNLNESLKEGGRSNVSSGSHRLRRVLVVAEFALALCLLTGAGLALRSFYKMTSRDLGVRTDHVLTFELSRPPKSFSSAAQITAFYRQILANITASPGVSSASFSANLPLQPAYRLPFGIPGRTAVELGSNPVVGIDTVTPEYFRTFGVRLLSGRAFTDQDAIGATPVAVVNEAFVRHYLSGQDPLTQQVLIPSLDPLSQTNPLGPMVTRQIVGVFHDIRNAGPRQSDVPEVYVPFAQFPYNDVFGAVRTAADPRGVIKGIAAAVNSVDADLPMVRVRTLDDAYSQTFEGDRWIITLFTGFGISALLLAILGVYGVMSYSVAQRTHEIGIRMALGAGRERMLRMILADALRLAAFGVVIGLAGAFGLTRLMGSSLYGISATDPVTFLGVVLLLVSVAAAGCYVPARRATRVDPMIALRYE